MSNLEIKKSIRERNLEIQCPVVEIRQKSGSAPLLKGYGTIKCSEQGLIYLQFICIEHNVKPKGFSSSIPENPSDPYTLLTLNATTIDNQEITSQGIQIRKLATYKKYSMVDIPLKEFMHTESNRIESDEKFLSFEFIGKSNIPKNKGNTTSSTLGSKSWSLNQAVIDIEGATRISIVDHGEHSEIWAKGDFDSDELYESLFFYLGLSRGSPPQIYCRTLGWKGVYTHTYKSFNFDEAWESMPAPIAKNILIKDKFEENFHYKLLEKIWICRKHQKDRFTCTFSHWLRVFQSFLSAREISNLTLATSIEGLLIDIYIPTIQKKYSDPAFDKTKTEITKKIYGLDLDEDHKKTLERFILRWGNIHASKALMTLVELELITLKEKKSWDRVRNSAAHPKLSPENSGNEDKSLSRMTDCLNVFYKLLLNALEFEGPILLYRGSEKAEITIMKNMPIIDPLPSCTSP